MSYDPGHASAAAGAVWAFATLHVVVAAGPFGLAETPPMGWRSWNSMGAGVTQDKMQVVMDKLVQKRAGGVSLHDVGYRTAGLDDGWQACGTGVNQSFHDLAGTPLPNLTTFPSLAAMVAHGHSKSVAVGFYINNCICAENMWRGGGWQAEMADRVYTGTAKFIADAGFDGVKVDSCSQFTNMTRWAALFQKPMVLEDCHASDAQDPCPAAMVCPESAVCPYNLWRLGGDIGASWGSVFNNLQSVLAWNTPEPSLSRPHRWGYPDMMQVGQLATFAEDRAHFGAWCVVSSPLTLGFDLTDDNVTARVWSIISNRRAIAINQAWAGDPGRLVRTLPPPANLGNATCGGHTCGVQVWVKRLSSNGTTAVFLINNADVAMKGTNASIVVDLRWLGLSGAGGFQLRDVWEDKLIPQPPAATSFATDPLGGHDSRFYVVAPRTAPPPATPGRAHKATCEEQCMAGAANVVGAPALGHCCTGLNSSDSSPSCAMGCSFARASASLMECENTCLRARFGGTGCTFMHANLTYNLCAGCDHGDDCAKLGVNDSGTCTVQTFEAWAPHRGCDYRDCMQGCLLALGCSA